MKEGEKWDFYERGTIYLEQNKKHRINIFYMLFLMFYFTAIELR